MSLLHYYLRRFVLSPFMLFILMFGAAAVGIVHSDIGHVSPSYGPTIKILQIAAEDMEMPIVFFFLFSGISLGLGAVLMLRTRVSEATLVSGHSRDRIFLAAAGAPLILMLVLWAAIFIFSYLFFELHVGYLPPITYLTFISIRLLQMLAIYFLVLALFLNFSDVFSVCLLILIPLYFYLLIKLGGMNLGVRDTYVARGLLLFFPQIIPDSILAKLVENKPEGLSGFKAGLQMDTLTMYIYYTLWLAFAFLASMFGFRRYREVGRAGTFDQSGF